MNDPTPRKKTSKTLKEKNKITDQGKAEKGTKTLPLKRRNDSIVKLKKSGATFKELSAMFGISEKRVKDIFYRERKKLCTGKT
jgi:DNA-binding CsgD family transcriptional regulator